VDKLDLQNDLQIKSRHTINNYLKTLENQGLIERSNGRELNEAFTKRAVNWTSFQGNHFYYKSVQKACKKRLISVQLEDLSVYLEQACSKEACNLNPKYTNIEENNFKIEENREKEEKTPNLGSKNARLKMHASLKLGKNTGTHPQNSLEKAFPSQINPVCEKEKLFSELNEVFKQ
jgi:predicted transcriptional regulator